jgi:pyridoxamine 5'-phosphate oxidase
MSPSWKPADLARLRVAYDRGELREDSLPPAPLAAFAAWLADALAAGLPEPNAMVLATADAAGRPTARTVLLKGVDAAGFRFFTHHGSRKARAIAENPRVALLFPWHALHRQVTVLGTVVCMPAAESAAYFATRPRDSQLAAWVSRQSEPLAGRAELERRQAEMARRWPDGAPVPMPETWGGYLVRAESVEFWQGGGARLHDRLRYEAVAPAPLDDPAAWTLRRYAP